MNRPLTTYEEHMLLERFPTADVGSDDFYSEDGHGIVTVNISIERLRDAAGDISDISRRAATLERATGSAWKGGKWCWTRSTSRCGNSY